MAVRNVNLSSGLPKQTDWDFCTIYYILTHRPIDKLLSFGHLRAAETSCEHIINILSPLRLMLNLQTNKCLFTQPAVAGQVH